MHKKTSNPLVTVYIPTHQRLSLLKRAVESVLLQTWPSIELIVVDDGSCDSTPFWLEQMQSENKLIYLRNEYPKGACYSRNRALAAANGEYITGLDDDDCFTPVRVERLMEAFFKHNCSCVTSSIVEHGANGRIKRPYDCGKTTLDQLLHHNRLGNQVLTRTDYLREIGGFDEMLPAFQDYDTWVRLIDRFGPAYKLSSLDYIWFTDHDANRISNNKDKRLQALNIFWQKHSHLMKLEHHQSMKMLEIRLSGKPFGISEMVRLINWKNKKSAIVLYANRNLRLLKRCVDRLRTHKVER